MKAISIATRLSSVRAKSLAKLSRVTPRNPGSGARFAKVMWEELVVYSVLCVCVLVVWGEAHVLPCPSHVGVRPPQGAAKGGQNDKTKAETGHNLGQSRWKCHGGRRLTDQTLRWRGFARVVHRMPVVFVTCTSCHLARHVKWNRSSVWVCVPVLLSELVSCVFSCSS